MEINITWNVCRVCLQEENNAANSASLQMRNIFDAKDFGTAKHIYDCTQIEIKPNDSLPQKICRKCSQVLKLAVNFRTTCQNSNSYLQNILEKAKSTTSLFKMDKPRELDFDDIIESHNDELYEANNVTALANDSAENCKQESLQLKQKEDEQAQAGKSVDFVNDLQPQHGSTMSILKSAVNVEKSSSSSTIIHTPATVDLSDLFLSTHSDTETIDDGRDEQNDGEVIDYVQFSNDKSGLEIENSGQAGGATPTNTAAAVAAAAEEVQIYEDNENAHFLSIKNLEEPLNDEEVEEHAEMLETNSHEPVDIVRNDANDELFYIFGEDIITKPVVAAVDDDADVDDHIIDEHKGTLTNTTVTVAATTAHTATATNELDINSCDEMIADNDDEADENCDVLNENDVKHDGDDDDNDASNSNDNDDTDNITMIDEADGDDAVFDSMDYIDEEYVKCEDISRDSTPIMQHENSLYYEDDERLFVMEAEPKIENYKQFNKLRPNLDFIVDSFPCNMKLTPHQQQKQRIPTQHLGIAECTCPICGNLLNSRSLLKHHMKIHRNERNHECEICLKRFTTSCNLTTHIRVHTGEKPYKCKYCDRKFSDKSTLVKHERSHTDERPYICQVCQKAFSLSSSLKAHERVHTGEKPYNCEPCGKAFKLLHQLKAHRATNAHRLKMDEEFAGTIET